MSGHVLVSLGDSMVSAAALAAWMAAEAAWNADGTRFASPKWFSVCARWGERKAINRGDCYETLDACRGAGHFALFLELCAAGHRRRRQKNRSEERRVGKECRSRWSL